MTRSRSRDSAAIASSARREVLDVLRAASEPLDAAAVAEILGSHVTTARFHLDHLVGAGLVQRTPGCEKRRGRPRILYSPIAESRDEDARDHLLTVLAAALAGEPDGSERAVRAGHRWATNLTAPVAHSDHAGTRLVGVLDDLGFAPQVGEHDIRLHACPFREVARAHPEVVCSIHRGLVEQLSDTTVALLPFVEPDLCVIRLDPVAS